MRSTGFLITLLTPFAIAMPALAQGPVYDQGQGPPQGQGQVQGQYQQPYYLQGQTQGAPSVGYPGYPTMPPQGMPGQPGAAQMMPQATTSAAPSAKQPPGKGMSVAQWFHAYDQIRHAAQMSPSEKQRADSLMSRGLSVLIPGDEKQATKALLYSMVTRYQKACQELRNLPQLAQTSNLHHAYYNYFTTAGQLFSDYVRVQDNLFITDAQTGQPLASSLLQRKQMLEGFEHQCKMLDSQVRQQNGIAAYLW